MNGRTALGIAAAKKTRGTAAETRLALKEVNEVSADFCADKQPLMRAGVAEGFLLSLTPSACHGGIDGHGRRLIPATQGRPMLGIVAQLISTDTLAPR